ncbi:putative membrane protein [Sphingomonas naasensis]|uniref:Uncharacterized protein n=1 Tax=Sphingomonas naasensis TaxID=1344951 RepID=A0A4S1W9W4_9SPHN|nr:hypothetical protein [Sphingomonas naasensis]NIJ19628.1 putative membrane protein [Sphingomonas naasensis]TGX37296.1 hypothetical protein E5A74_20345 [Sphingomonas naasensis]
MSDPLATLWAQQHADAVPPDADALARADARFRRGIRRRDAIEYVAGLLGIGVFAHTAWQAPDWGIRIGCAAIILGVLVVMRNLWKRRPQRPDSALGAPSLAFHRANLVAQRDTVASVWRWYLAPPVPGMVLLLLAILRVSAERMPLWAALLAMLLTALPVAGVFWGIHRLNLAAARRLQTMIDALDRGEL